MKEQSRVHLSEQSKAAVTELRMIQWLKGDTGLFLLMKQSFQLAFGSNSLTEM